MKYLICVSEMTYFYQPHLLQDLAIILLTGKVTFIEIPELNGRWLPRQ